MLQIISKKFFKKESVYQNPRKGILFSNYSWVASFQTKITEITPCSRYSTFPASFVLEFDVNIEKEEKPGLVCVGEAEVVNDLQAILTIGLRSYFNEDKVNVESMCRDLPRHSTQDIVPKKFVPRIFDTSIHGTTKEIEDFILFMENLINLKRKDYLTLLSVIQNIYSSLQALSFNFDLAYSMLIYSLETMSQAYDNYEPTWDNYDPSQKMKLENFMENLTTDQKNNLKNILLSSSHQKLTQRFIHFVTSNLSDNFFTIDSKEIKRPIRKFELSRALKNSYKIRSQFVHSLRPVLDHLKLSQLATGEVFIWEGEPYLTYQGLFRICRSTIMELVTNLEKIEKEDYNWRSDLPGIISMRLDSQYWIYHKEIKQTQRLEALLEQFSELIISEKPITNLTNILKDSINHSESLKKEEREALFWNTLYFTSFFQREDCDSSFMDFLSRNEEMITKCSIFSLIHYVHNAQDFPWTADKCLEILNEYDEKIYHQDQIKIPHCHYIIIAAQISCMLKKENNKEQYLKLIQKMILDSAGFPDLQHYLKESMTSGQDPEMGALIEKLRAKKA